MPFAGGSFSLYTPGNPVVTNTTISSAWANNTLSDIATGLSTCVLKDGTQTITANIPMSGYKLTGLAAGTSNGDSVRYEQVVGAYLPITGGTLTGNLLFTDATYDIGASGATRPRDFYLSRNAVIGGTLNVTGHPTLEGVTATGATGTGNLVFATSPTLSLASASTGTTQSAGDNSTKLATTAYVDRLGVNGQVLLEDQKASGTDAGTFTSGAWQTRTLNTEVYDAGGLCTLASNKFTLGAGTYLIVARAPAYNVVFHQTRIQNVTDGTTVQYGGSMITNTTVATDSVVSTVVTIAGSKDFELQHRCSSTQATDGFGRACGFGNTEVYASVRIWKLS